MDLVFQFDSLHDFWFMSGHGPYVWAAYAITLLGFAVLAWQGCQRRSQVIKKIRLAHMAKSQAHSKMTRK